MKHSSLPCILLCGMIALTSCDSHHGAVSFAAGAGTTTVVRVKATRARRLPATYTLDFPGVVRADIESHLSFRVPGLITRLPIRVGQPVRKGDVVAQLDLTRYQNLRDQAKAGLARASARQKDAQANFQRESELWKQKIVSKEEFQSAQATAESAEDELMLAKKRLSDAERQLSYATLTAPYDGIIAQKKVHVFETVDTGQPVALLVDPTNILFRTQLPTSLLDEKDDFIGYACIFPCFNDLVVTAKLHGIGPSALPPIRTFPLEVQLTPPEGVPVMPGTEGILRIAVRNAKTNQHVLVPASAIVGDHSGHPRVWVVESGRAHPRAVKIEGLHDGEIALKSGVSAGADIVTAGQLKLTPGRKVLAVTPFAEEK